MPRRDLSRYEFPNNHGDLAIKTSTCGGINSGRLLLGLSNVTAYIGKSETTEMRESVY